MKTKLIEVAAAAVLAVSPQTKAITRRETLASNDRQERQHQPDKTPEVIKRITARTALASNLDEEKEDESDKTPEAIKKITADKATFVREVTKMLLRR